MQPCPPRVPPGLIPAVTANGNEPHWRQPTRHSLVSKTGRSLDVVVPAAGHTCETSITQSSRGAVITHCKSRYMEFRHEPFDRKMTRFGLLLVAAFPEPQPSNTMGRRSHPSPTTMTNRSYRLHLGSCRFPPIIRSKNSTPCHIHGGPQLQSESFGVKRQAT